MRRLAKREGVLGTRLGFLRLRARIAVKSGQLAKAERIWAQAEDLVKHAAGAHSHQLAEVVATRSRLLWELGRREAALGQLRRYWDKRRERAAFPVVSDDEIEPVAQYGHYLIELHRPQDALPPLRAAMLAEAERQDAEVEWRVLSATAELAGQQGQHHAAILFGKMAVQVIASSIRFLDGSSRERAVFLNDRLAPFQRLRDRLVGAGRYPEAGQILALMKAEQVYELANRDAGLDRRSRVVSYRSDEAAMRRHWRRCCRQLQDARNAAVDPSKTASEKPAKARAVQPMRQAAASACDAMLSESWVKLRRVAPPVRRNDRIASGVAVLRYFSTASGIAAHAQSPQQVIEHTVDAPKDLLAETVFR